MSIIHTEMIGVPPYSDPQMLPAELEGNNLPGQSRHQGYESRLQQTPWDEPFMHTSMVCLGETPGRIALSLGAASKCLEQQAVPTKCWVSLLPLLMMLRTR